MTNQREKLNQEINLLRASLSAGIISEEEFEKSRNRLEEKLKSLEIEEKKEESFYNLSDNKDNGEKPVIAEHEAGKETESKDEEEQRADEEKTKTETHPETRIEKEQVEKEIKYIKYPTYTNILLKSKAITKMKVEETEK